MRSSVMTMVVSDNSVSRRFTGFMERVCNRTPRSSRDGLFLRLFQSDTPAFTRYVARATDGTVRTCHCDAGWGIHTRSPDQLSRQTVPEHEYRPMKHRSHTRPGMKRWMRAFGGFCCAAGFLVEGLSPVDAIFITVSAVTTVGYSPPRALSAGAKVFTTFLILTGAATGIYVLGSMTEFLVEGSLRGGLQQRKMVKRVERLRDHYIIAGF